MLFSPLLIFGVLTSSAIYANGRPQHAVALVGHNITFDFITSVPASQIRWDHKSAITTKSFILIDGFSVKDNRSGRVRVVHNPADITGSRLFIDDIQSIDAGTYSCIDGTSRATQLTAELIVLADVPPCYTNITSAKYIVEESDEVLVTCNISSYGALFPKVTCDSDSTQTRLVNAGFTSDNRSYSCFTWNVVATTVMHGTHIECRVWFEYQQETFYNSTWISPTISVAYGPHSVTIHPQNQTVFEDGDQLECTADANPQPQYHWIVGNTVKSGQTLTVDVCRFLSTVGNIISTRVLVKCIADRDTRTATTTKEIELSVSYTQLQLCSHLGDHGDSSSSSEHECPSLQYTAVVVIASVVPTLVVALVVFFICWRLRTRTSDTSLLPVTSTGEKQNDQLIAAGKSLLSMIPTEEIQNDYRLTAEGKSRLPVVPTEEMQNEKLTATESQTATEQRVTHQYEEVVLSDEHVTYLKSLMPAPAVNVPESDDEKDNYEELDDGTRDTSRGPPFAYMHLTRTLTADDTVAV